MHLNIAFLPNAQNVGFSRSSSIYRVFRNVWSIRSVLIQALTCCVTEREAQGAEKGSAEHQNLYAVAGALCFLHQSDKWHNEATSLNVREPSVALPVGLCCRQKGETREEGGHALDLSYISILRGPRIVNLSVLLF